MMIVMQKLKFMQEFTFAIDVKCLNTDQQYVRFLKTQEMSEKQKPSSFFFSRFIYMYTQQQKKRENL